MFIVLIALPHVPFLEEMLTKFPLTLLKLMFNVYLILFLFFYVTLEFPPVLYDFGLGVENLGVLHVVTFLLSLLLRLIGYCPTCSKYSTIVSYDTTFVRDGIFERSSLIGSTHYIFFEIL